jgi:hypothetical protein
MAIIIHTKDDSVKYAYLNIFPDQFKTEKEKENETYIKQTLDYFGNKAYSEYVRNKTTFVKNYDLVKGVLKSSDFYEDENVKSFADMLEGDLDLPSYVKHYSILTTPINELVGELTKRPDGYKVKAFDDESKAEELEFKTDLLQEYIINQVKTKLQQKAELAGEEMDEEQLEQITMEQVQEELDVYTSIAEKWGNHTLTALKAEFNLKELSEDAFRDLLIAARQYYHVYEDNSKTGFNVEVLNPKNVWFLSTPDRKYIADPSGRARGAYAAGTVHVMEISEIIESCPELSKEEIDHLRKGVENYGLLNTRESNLGRNVAPGTQSITYDTYDPLVLQSRMMIESDMKGNQDSLNDFLGLSSNVSAFGHKFVVCKSYWIGKKKIGKLTFIDEMEVEQSMLVDESYKKGDHPNEIDLEWGYVNQIYWGRKIGPDIYHMGPFKLLPYLPIIGTVYENKNTEPQSLVDMMKPFQVIYNVCVNQMFELLKKEKGNVGVVNVRRIPRVKDGDGQDDIDIWEMEAMERGIMFDDDSPENTKAPVTNQSVIRNVDLTRTNEIQSRYNLAVQMKNECWELIGMSRQRMGTVQASETATGTNTAMQQSYAQTEPIYVAHEYVTGQLYQAMVDAAQYVQSTNETSTLSYITSQGESAFLSVQGSDITLKELKVFMTNRPEDIKMFADIRNLSQAVLQNGGSLYDVIEMYSENSVRSLKGKFKKIRDKIDAQQAQAQQLEEQKLAQQQEAMQAQLAQQEQQAQIEMENDNLQKELDRINAKEIAQIRALQFGKIEGADANNNGIADLMENTKFAAQRSMAQDAHNLKIQDIQSKHSLGMAKLAVDLKNQTNDLDIAKQNAKNRGTKKS